MRDLIYEEAVTHKFALLPLPNRFLIDMTRARWIQIRFTAVALVIVAGIALAASVTTGTGAILLALCLVPPAIILKLWPGRPPQTIAEVLHDAERR